MMEIRIATWNLEWATQRAANWPTIESRLASVDADVVVLTEMTIPLRLVDDVGSPGLPPANFVAVDVEVDEGQSIRVIGLVVGWAERSRYVDHLPAALDANLGPKTIVAGDFNHRLIDHIASTTDLVVAGPVVVWPRHDPSYRNGTKEVTDHAGSAVDFVV